VLKLTVFEKKLNNIKKTNSDLTNEISGVSETNVTLEKDNRTLSEVQKLVGGNLTSSSSAVEAMDAKVKSIQVEIETSLAQNKEKETNALDSLFSAVDENSNNMIESNEFDTIKEILEQIFNRPVKFEEFGPNKEGSISYEDFTAKFATLLEKVTSN